MRRGWTVRDSLELYMVPNWGTGFFDINGQGHVEVMPRGAEGASIDLLELVQDLERRGLRAPLLIRFVLPRSNAVSRRVSADLSLRASHRYQ